MTRTRTASPSLGPSKHDGALAAAQEAAEGGRFEEVETLLAPILAEYRSLPRGDVVYAVPTPRETVGAVAEAALAQARAGKAGDVQIAVVPLDPAFPAALGIQAYVQVERKQYTAALDTLREQESLLRTDPGPTNERGFVLLMLRQPAEALDAYRMGLERARRFEAPKEVQALSLRGIGIAQIDLGRLGEARAALRESLTLDPGNHVAENELRYIEQLEAQAR